MRSIKFWITLLLGCLCSMGLSYLIVRHATRELTLVERISPTALHTAELLRANANALAKLAQEYLDRYPENGAAPKDPIWLERDFKPRIFALTEDFELQAESPNNAVNTHAPAFTALLEAARKLTTAAAHPTDQELHRITIRDLRRALDTAEAQIQALKATPYLTEPLLKLKN